MKQANLHDFVAPFCDMLFRPLGCGQLGVRVVACCCFTTLFRVEPFNENVRAIWVFLKYEFFFVSTQKMTLFDFFVCSWNAWKVIWLCGEHKWRALFDIGISFYLAFRWKFLWLRHFYYVLCRSRRISVCSVLFYFCGRKMWRFMGNIIIWSSGLRHSLLCLGRLTLTFAA